MASKNTPKTPEGLTALINELKAQADQMRAEEQRETTKQQTKIAAQALKDVFDSFIEVGFTEDQAFEFTVITLQIMTKQEDC